MRVPLPLEADPLHDEGAEERCWDGVDVLMDVGKGFGLPDLPYKRLCHN